MKANRKIARAFKPFIKTMMPNYEFNWHHELIIQELEDFIFNDELDVLFIAAPARHGKSTIVSQMLPPFYLGHFPSHEVIMASYSQELASKFGRLSKNIIDSPVYKSIFGFGLAKDSKGKSEFSTEYGGEYHAVGVGSGLTGKGGHLIICDDTLKGRKEAQSRTVRKSLHEWFDSTLFLRRQKKAKIIIMSTRWHVEDLHGYVQTKYKFLRSKEISFPILNASETESLWPSFMPIDQVLKIKNSEAMTPRNWFSLYLQKPVVDSGNIFTDDMLLRWKPSTLPAKFQQVIMSWDMTFKDTNQSDFVVGQVWGKRGPNAYLLDQVRRKMDFPSTLKAFAAMMEKWPQAYTKLIEDKANGSGIISMLKKKVSGILEIEPEGSKVERAEEVKTWFETGNVWIPEDDYAPWVKEYVVEMKEFDSGDNDDQVDSTTQAVKYLFGTESDRLEKLLQY